MITIKGVTQHARAFSSVYVCLHMFMHECCVSVYVFMCACCRRLYLFLYMCSCMHRQLYMYMIVCLFLCVCTCACLCIYMCVCVPADHIIPLLSMFFFLLAISCFKTSKKALLHNSVEVVSPLCALHSPLLDTFHACVMQLGACQQDNSVQHVLSAYRVSAVYCQTGTTILHSSCKVLLLSLKSPATRTQSSPPF